MGEIYRMINIKNDKSEVTFSVVTLIDTPTQLEKIEIANFIYTHAEGHLDSQENIIRCLDYAFGSVRNSHGFVVVGRDSATIGDQSIVSAAIVLNTGMGGYFPENLLVYFVVKPEFVSDSLIENMMDKVGSFAKGEIAIRMRHDHPYKGNFSHLGFDNEYCELRRA